MKKINVIFPFAMILLALTFISCSKSTRSIKGTGPIVERDFNFPPISGTALSIDANVIVTQGDSQTVIIRGQQNIIDNIVIFFITLNNLIVPLPVEWANGLKSME